MCLYSKIKYDYDCVVPGKVYVPSILFSDSGCQHNKYTLLESTLLYIFAKNIRMTRMCYSTARSFHYLHYYHHQRPLRHVLAQNDKVQAKPSPRI